MYSDFSFIHVSAQLIGQGAKQWQGLTLAGNNRSGALCINWRCGQNAIDQKYGQHPTDWLNRLI
jgi:hypothetical protein